MVWTTWLQFLHRYAWPQVKMWPFHYKSDTPPLHHHAMNITVTSLLSNYFIPETNPSEENKKSNRILDSCLIYS